MLFCIRYGSRLVCDQDCRIIIERMIAMTAIDSAVESVISSPQKRYTKQEAQAMLRKYGVLREDNSISEKFRPIFVQRSDNKNDRS